MRPSTLLPLVVQRLLASAFALVASASVAVAQSRVVNTPAAVLSAPNGKTIGAVRPGVAVVVTQTRGAYARVTLDGFVERARVVIPRSKATPRVGGRSAIVRSRGTTSARSVGSLDAGTTIAVSTSGAPAGWVKVRRSGWVLVSSLEKPAAEVARSATPAKRTASTPTKKSATGGRTASAGEVAPSPAAAKKPTPTPVKTATPAPAPAAVAAKAPVATAAEPPAPAATLAVSALSDSTLVPTANVALRAAPDAKPLATVAQGTTLTPLARDRGWVRVRLEGWVQEKDVAPADTSVRMGVSAADLRADPVGTRGKVVRWSVQVLARQKADPLRKDLAVDETYLLARGPYEENALLYLVVPPSLMVIAKSIPELSEAMITARVRTGRSDLVGVPILDLLTITARK